jgi:hypothetical protein
VFQKLHEILVRICVLRCNRTTLGLLSPFIDQVRAGRAAMGNPQTKLGVRVKQYQNAATQETRNCPPTETLDLFGGLRGQVILGGYSVSF